MKPNFSETAEKLILFARRGDDAQASSMIPLYLGLLEQRMLQMSESQRKSVEASLSALLKAQMDQDWVRFADLLETGEGLR